MITKLKPAFSNFEEFTHTADSFPIEETPKYKASQSKLLTEENWNEFISYFPSNQNFSKNPLKSPQKSKQLEWDGTSPQSSSQTTWSWSCRHETEENLNSIVERMDDKLSSLLSSQHKLLSFLMDTHTGETYQANDLCKLMQLRRDNSKLHVENCRLRRHLAMMKS
ncbi:unnamed protein product [Blepharisma stoltei]|uniref:Uncharacterized protein n=1 Tax=Blepharisma stoltei TaxID=1481888 RepID=A0AAU9K7K1_9CILI|nr:unnamed protein product [Blepharisma stoltei]